MKQLLNLVRTEPAAITGLVVAIITVVVAFGVPIDDSQRSAIVGVVGAVLAILGAGVVRSQVTPLAKTKPRKK